MTSDEDTASSAARTAVGVVAMALFGAGLLWFIFVGLQSTPCGIEGPGFLQGSDECPLKAAHYLRAIVGGLGLLSAALSFLFGLAFCESGRRRWLRAFAWTLGLALLLAALWDVVLKEFPA